MSKEAVIPPPMPTCRRPLVAELIVEKESAGIRIDSFLTRHFRNYTRWRFQRLASAGQITCDGSPLGPHDRVFTGQRVAVRLIEPPDKLLDPEPHPLDILYEDPWLIAVAKPAGMVAHPTGPIQNGTLANALQAVLDERMAVRGILRPGIVHRLDRETSGVMVVATTHQSHQRLSTAFEAGQVAKTYLALVAGRLDREELTIDLPIGRMPGGNRVLMSCRGDAIGAKPSRTVVRVLQRGSQATLISARPLSGRNHQIRVHLAHAGHPVIGDEFYAAGGRIRDPDEPRTTDRQMLHAMQLELAHPITGVWLTLTAAAPVDLDQESRVHLAR